MQIILDIQNEQDLLLLLSIAKRIGVKVVEEKKMEKSYDYHIKIIKQGVKKSSFGDPMNWQREVRSDRPLSQR